MQVVGGRVSLWPNAFSNLRVTATNGEHSALLKSARPLRRSEPRDSAPTSRGVSEAAGRSFRSSTSGVQVHRHGSTDACVVRARSMTALSAARLSKSRLHVGENLTAARMFGDPVGKLANAPHVWAKPVAEPLFLLCALFFRAQAKLPARPKDLW